jgi:hypothetical protein
LQNRSHVKRPRHKEIISNLKFGISKKAQRGIDDYNEDEKQSFA